MATSRSHIAVRLIAMAAGISLLFASGACSTGSENDVNANGATTVTTSKTTAGTVAIFTPSDGITISQRTPLNKWAKLTPQITEELIGQGVRKDAIEKTTSDSLDQQSHDVQDWIVDHMTASQDSSDGGNDSSDPSHTTIIVAPVVDADPSTRQYGDYVTQPTDSSDSTDAGSSDSSAGDTDEQDAYDRLDAALKLAKDAGMHVVLLSNGVDGFSPDAFVRFSTAEQIGALQATKLIAKLDLDKASKDNPKAIEVLIPYSASGDEQSNEVGSGSKSDAASDAKSDETDTGETTQFDDAFARAAFSGMWRILQPYFNQGKAYSPSGLLDKNTKDSDWRAVAVPADDEKHIAAALDERLPIEKNDAGTTYTKVDGIIAMNDYVASVVTDELASLGYTGSAADINPSITISGIVGNITGKKDLQRGKVPDPVKAPDADGESAGNDDTDSSDSTQDPNADDESDSRWPIVTGFGGYVDTIPQVVNGKQWMTGLENRNALAADIAETTVRLNRGESLADLKYITKELVPGSSSKTKVSTISEDALSVSAYNLKTVLIDPGYITMADAGL
ncbi:hypothetical protein BW13_06005 [Bifidobacterium sp. UTCIF-37]|uniref:hypothetical protein n=1 Tax=unclassified Bifidobacterium TaxID=2608897 RepID=UPI001128F004|nr:MULTISPECIES: hypothetical protein [unclassified Bifidobacterium]TPF86359.1 hypothetical protein BW13_06005 [Bifidobacterium sp. UTCIF-37]TPF88819.1 hypothetical protein BW11_06805 [Bifidobacterium sp. UTCIF-38]